MKRTEAFNQTGVAESTCINTGIPRGNWTIDETAANANILIATRFSPFRFFAFQSGIPQLV